MKLGIKVKSDRIMKKITIVGANSYIARNFIKHIASKEVSLKLYDIGEEHKDGLTAYNKVNLLVKEDIKKIDYDCAIIYLFSGKTGTTNGFSQYEDFIDINEKGLLNFLSGYIANKSKAKIVFPSTRLIYKGCEQALEETAAKEFKTIYALNKFACEKYLEMYNNTFGVSYCIFRICVPFGYIIEDTSSYGTLEFFLNKAKNNENINIYGNGKQKRTFTYIKDLTEVLWLGGINEKCINDVFNIGGSEQLSIKEVAEKIAQRYNVEVVLKEWPELNRKIESGSTVFASKKLDNILNYQYTCTIDEWLEKLY